MICDPDCRCYVISHLPSLLVLDDHTINGEEREEARKVYGNRRVSVSSKRASKKHKEKVSILALCNSSLPGDYGDAHAPPPLSYGSSPPWDPPIVSI